MNAFELLRVGLEAAIAAQFTLFVLFLAATGDRSRPAGFFLSVLCVGLVVVVLLNALASAGISPGLRGLNYFIDLAMAPLLLGFVARAGGEGAPLLRTDAFHALVPVVGGVVLIVGWPAGPDLYVLTIQGVYLAAAVFLSRRRAMVLRGAGLENFTRAILGAFALVMALRAWVMLDARSLLSYRDSAAYPLILAVVLALASSMLWTALRKPRLLGWRAALTPDSLGDEEVARIERDFDGLIEGQRLYLEPNLTVADVAARLRVPPRHLSQVIASQFAENFSSFLNRKRAEAAARALREPEHLSVTAIMFDSGFGSKSAFQREFKRRFGVSPSEYRKRFKVENPGD
jgi:AraC-like DNA-binding protein